ncbi:hypothetical protein GS597_12145 [Synechococcales cyanobacterium C]|uniref:Uncharacterized protein n=1 Tax=Petrachloros mirabilis ULC683 TaxID=2781853 RepID=A0A8K2A007_9CYAN|nr:hypothetical protein [Petrachloros mirabilis]NCJ07242.1 hypothetical protein [Petrachloros mirabilis ULC683]
MCFGCVTLSAFTLLIPVADAPQPSNVPVLNAPAAKITQTQSMDSVPRFRAAIAQMIVAASQAPDAEIVHEELTSIHANLEGITDIAQAQDIVDDGMDILAQRVLAAPNADALIDLLYDLQTGSLTPQAQLRLPTSTLLSSNHPAWGWLS